MRDKTTMEVKDQLDADLLYMVKEKSVEVYEEVSQEKPRAGLEVGDVQDLIDDECLSKSNALEKVIKNKEALMVSYFRSLQDGNTKKLEEIKAQIKAVGDDVYEKFLVDLDKKIIDILKTLDMDKLLKEKKETKASYKVELEPTVAEIKVAEEVKPVLTQEVVQEPVQATETVVDDEGLEEGIYNPNHSGNRDFILNRIMPNRDKQEDNYESSPVIDSIMSTPVQPVLDNTAPKFDTIKEEMNAVGIKVPNNKEKDLPTRITEKGRTAVLNTEGHIIEIDNVRLDMMIYNSVNFFRNMTEDEAYENQVESDRIKKMKADPNYNYEVGAIV